MCTNQRGVRVSVHRRWQVQNEHTGLDKVCGCLPTLQVSRSFNVESIHGYREYSLAENILRCQGHATVLGKFTGNSIFSTISFKYEEHPQASTCIMIFPSSRPSVSIVVAGKTRSMFAGNDNHLKSSSKKVMLCMYGPQSPSRRDDEKAAGGDPLTGQDGSRDIDTKRYRPFFPCAMLAKAHCIRCTCWRPLHCTWSITFCPMKIYLWLRMCADGPRAKAVVTHQPSHSSTAARPKFSSLGKQSSTCNEVHQSRRCDLGLLASTSSISSPRAACHPITVHSPLSTHYHGVFRKHRAWHMRASPLWQPSQRIYSARRLRLRPI